MKKMKGDAMGEALYRIVFSGEIAPGQKPADVKQQLAALYKKDIATIERNMFSGKEVIVKNRLERRKATDLQASLSAKTGALFEVRPIPESDRDGLTAPPDASASEAESTGTLRTEPPSSQGQPDDTPDSPFSSGQGPADDLTRRIGFWPRLAASIVDANLILLVALPISILFGSLLGGLIGFLGTSPEFAGAGSIFGIFGGMWLGSMLCGYGYSAFEVFKGASPGKMMIGVKIMNANGSPANLKTLFLRFLLKNILWPFGILAALTNLEWINWIGSALWVLWFIGCFWAFGQSRQALHDRLLKTAVYPIVKALQKPKKARAPKPAKQPKPAKPPKPSMTRRQKIDWGIEFAVGLGVGLALAFGAWYYVIAPSVLQQMGK